MSLLVHLIKGRFIKREENINLPMEKFESQWGQVTALELYSVRLCTYMYVHTNSTCGFRRRYVSPNARGAVPFCLRFSITPNRDQT